MDGLSHLEVSLWVGVWLLDDLGSLLSVQDGLFRVPVASVLGWYIGMKVDVV